MSDGDERSRAAAVFDALGGEYERAFAHSAAASGAGGWKRAAPSPTSAVATIVFSFMSRSL